MCDLIIIKKALVGLINRTAGDSAGTGGAGPGSAGIGKIDTRLLGRIKDVNVVSAREAGATLDLDRVAGHFEEPEN